MASNRILTGMRAFYKDFLSLDVDVVKDPTFYPKYSVAVADAAKEETLQTMLAFRNGIGNHRARMYCLAV